MWIMFSVPKCDSGVSGLIILLFIIIALDNAPYKILNKLKSARSIWKKNNSNKCVFKCIAKVSEPTGRSLNSTGNSLQQLGPATAKALKSQSVL